MRIISPTWEDLLGLIKGASTDLILCSPYISAAGVNRIFDVLGDTKRVRLFSRLSPSDWAAGVSDPESVLALLEVLVEAGKTADLFVVQRLHAKFYAADDNRVMLGSANLTGGGFDSNLELMVDLRGPEAMGALKEFDQVIPPAGRKLTLQRLRSWIGAAQESVTSIRNAAAVDAERLAEAQRGLDRLLGYGLASRTRREPSPKELSAFIEWLHLNHGLPGAEVVIRRHENADKQNLQGHVKQCFAGAVRFFDESRELIDIVSSQVESLKDEDDMFHLDSRAEVIRAWLDHIDRNATAKGDHYDYAVLRGILPPSLGGTRQGGGGGSSTLQRMVLLVARYLQRSAPS